MSASKQFHQDGFYLSPPIIPMDLVDRVIPRMDAIMEGEYETGIPPYRAWDVGDDEQRIRKIDQAHLSDHTVFELVTYPEIGRWAAELFDAKQVQLWASQMLYKPPGGQITGNIGWHQDKQYWSYLEGELFTAWVAISDVTQDAGPMNFVRGSHKWGFLDSGDFFGHDHEAQRAAIPVPDEETWEEVPAVLPPGAVSFHDCQTYHASGPNTSSGPRLSFALHLKTEKAHVVEGADNHYVQHLDDPAYCPVIFEA